MRHPKDETGSALVVALVSTLLMLALGLALLAVVDTQANDTVVERGKDRTFNLAEGVLTSEAFVLGRNWPSSAISSGTGTVSTPVESDCGSAAAGFSATLGTTPASGTAAALVQANLNATYFLNDAAYATSSWQVNICDNTGGAVWNNSLLATNGTGAKNWDKNGDNLLWVRAQATVSGKTRAVAGLVKVRTGPALQSKYGLVSGNVSEDLSTTLASITNTSVVSGLTSSLINSAPPVLADPTVPLPNSGVTGLRCGLLNNTNLQKSCVTGTIGALSAVPAVNTLVTNGAYTQFPQTTSTDDGTIGQLRAQAKASNTYLPASTPSAGATANGTYSNVPACTIPGSPSASTVVFIESVGTGDQSCVIDVSTASRSYKALVVANGRVIIRGDNTNTAYAANASKNLFSGVIYALNKQTANQNSSTPSKEVVRIDKGARVRGAINADGKNATVNIVPPDFDSAALVNGLLCPGALCVLAPTLNGLVGTLGLDGTLNALINGTCLVSLPILGCTVTLPGLGATAVLGGLLSQLSTYGSAVHSDVALINALTVYGASGVVPGTFKDLNPSL